ncbi:Sodium-dependent nutrient amino acid transporter 1, partial [Gryllus bimaculatus]
MKKGRKSYDLGGSVELGAVNAGFEADEDARKAAEAAAANANGVHKEVAVGEVQGDEPERQQWSSPVEFLMSCIAMSVGLGNIWRFPFTAYENGGGAFLIPYIIVLLVIGKPLYYLEMALGQFTSFGCVKVWNMMPALKGMGYGQVYATGLVLTYYCSLMALTVFYLYSSFAATLPWAACDDAWTDGVACLNSSATAEQQNTSGTTPSAELYFYKFVLNEPKDIFDGVGAPDWRLSVCLLISWVVILLVIIRGVRSSGKAAYFLALFPYVVLVILLIRGCTLPGAVQGIIYFVNPQWDKLLEPMMSREVRARRDAAVARGAEPEALPWLPVSGRFWSFWGSVVAASFRPNALWRPKAHKHFKEWVEFKEARAR